MGQKIHSLPPLSPLFPLLVSLSSFLCPFLFEFFFLLCSSLLCTRCSCLFPLSFFSLFFPLLLFFSSHFSPPSPLFPSPLTLIIHISLDKA